MALWLRVDSQNTPFDETDHYPILAGHNEPGTALYVAAAKNEPGYHFTCVEDGASTVRYADELGDARETDNFFVLALRHDPSDLIGTPPYPRIPTGAVDQTGPLFWLNFWPRKDPDYLAASDSAESDDDHLEAVLNSLSARDRDNDNDWIV